MIFVEEVWSWKVRDFLVASTAQFQLGKCIPETGVPTCVCELALQEMTKPLITKVNGFWRCPRARRLDIQVVHSGRGGLDAQARSVCDKGTD